MILIACADRGWGIGYKNRLLFSIPEDMSFFRQITAGKTVVMGRKTFDSLKVKPLSGRRNILLTRNRSFVFEGVEIVHSTKELAELTQNTKSEDIVVIGGSQVYKQLMEYCDTAYITKVFAESPADSFLPDFDSLEDWKVAEMSDIKEHNGLKYRFVTYKRTPQQSRVCPGTDSI